MSNGYRYPESDCELHSNVRTSEPVCLMCLSDHIKSLETEVAELKAEVERLRKYHKLHEDHFDKVCETLSHPHYHGDDTKADECRRMSE